MNRYLPIGSREKRCGGNEGTPSIWRNWGLGAVVVVEAALSPCLGVTVQPPNGETAAITTEPKSVDFSFAGYETGSGPLPCVPTFCHLDAATGDSASRIQKAIDELGIQPLHADGYRGTIELGEGNFRVHRSIVISSDGIVISGAQRGRTRIVRVGQSSAPVFRIGDAPGAAAVGPGDLRTGITSQHVDNCGRGFEVDQPGAVKAGEMVEIIHPSTDPWLSSIDNGGTGTMPPWTRGSVTIRYFRQVSRLQSSRVRLDAPVFDALDRGLSRSSIRPDRTRTRHVGLRNLTIVIRAPTRESDVAASSGVRFAGVRDCWAETVNVRGFTFAGFEITAAVRCTLDGCRAKGAAGPGLRGFWLRRAQLILIRDCETSEVEQGYTSAGGPEDSGNVFLNCAVGAGVAIAAQSTRRWAHAFLFDGLKATAPGTRLCLNPEVNTPGFAGWSMAGSVAWNCVLDQGAVVVGGPSAFPNLAVGCKGQILNPPHEASRLVGLMGDEPQSLYAAQLTKRRGR